MALVKHLAAQKDLGMHYTLSIIDHVAGGMQ